MDPTRTLTGGTRKSQTSMAGQPSRPEIDPHDIDESIPPPPGSMGERATPTDQYLLERVNGASRTSKQALRLAEQAHSGITRLEQAFGSSPDPAQGKSGSGMLGVLSDLAGQFRQEREDRAKSRKTWSDIAKGVVIALGAVGTAFGILAKVFHW